MNAELFFQIATTVINVLFTLAVVFFVGWGLFMLFRLIRRFTVDRLVYGRHFSQECVYEGDTAELVETLWNPTLFPVFLVNVESYFYDGLQIAGHSAAKGEMQYFVSRYHLMPYERVTRRIEIQCVKRGYYKLMTATIFRAGGERCIESQAELCVYPRVDALHENTESVYGLGDALSRNRLIYDPFSVSGIREYRTGDPFHTINFKASARLFSGGNPRFAVNRYDYCASNRYYIYQNFHLPKGRELLFDAYEALVEDGLRISASLVVKAIDSGGVCAFAANCGTVDGRRQISFPLLGGEQHKRDILREMSLTRAMDGVSFSSMVAADVRRGITGSEVFIVTPYVDGLLSEQIALLEYLGNTVRVITLKEAI
jgi:uncharacterized protein (DUF58 family)